MVMPRRGDRGTLLPLLKICNDCEEVICKDFLVTGRPSGQADPPFDIEVGSARQFLVSRPDLAIPLVHPAGILQGALGYVNSVQGLGGTAEAHIEQRLLVGRFGETQCVHKDVGDSHSLRLVAGNGIGVVDVLPVVL